MFCEIVYAQQDNIKNQLDARSCFSLSYIPVSIEHSVLVEDLSNFDTEKQPRWGVSGK